MVLVVGKVRQGLQLDGYASHIWWKNVEKKLDIEKTAKQDSFVNAHQKIGWKPIFHTYAFNRHGSE